MLDNHTSNRMMTGRDDAIVFFHHGGQNGGGIHKQSKMVKKEKRDM
jgi:hypothetical protein